MLALITITSGHTTENLPEKVGLFTNDGCGQYPGKTTIEI